MVFNREYCEDIVVFDDVADIMDEFKGTQVTPTKIAIHRPNHGKAWYSYDSVEIWDKNRKVV